MGDLKGKLEDVFQLGTAYLCLCVAMPLLVASAFGVDSMWAMALVVGVASGLGVLAWRKLTPGVVPDAKLVDSVFGEMTWHKVGGAGLDYWEGNIQLDPEVGIVEVWVYAGKAGPSSEQRKMLTQIREQYATHKSDIQSMLDDYTEHVGWDFTLLSILIGGNASEQEWKASYVADTEDDGDMGYYIKFKNGEINGLSAGD